MPNEWLKVPEPSENTILINERDRLNKTINDVYGKLADASLTGIAVIAHQEKLQQRILALKEVVRRFIEEDPVHEEGCPQDDTCNCEFARQINAAMRDPV